jgi:hypothetical protein
MKKISSFEFALNNAVGRSDLNQGVEPRTRFEEEQAANKRLEQQLSRFNNATTGQPLFPELREKLHNETDEHRKTSKQV